MVRIALNLGLYALGLSAMLLLTFAGLWRLCGASQDLLILQLLLLPGLFSLALVCFHYAWAQAEKFAAFCHLSLKTRLPQVFRPDEWQSTLQFHVYSFLVSLSFVFLLN